MPKVYYVDAIGGSDANAGTSADAAFQSLEAVEQIKLQPGDTVLLARGSTFDSQLLIKDAGLAGSPITYGAYGEGTDPVIAGGIHGSKSHWIIIEDVAITGGTGNAIYAGNASNWVIDGVTIVGAADGPAMGGISFQKGSNLTVRNSTIENVNSDGIWVDGVKGVVIENNKVGAVYGANSDNVQVVNSQDVVVRGNTLEFADDSNSTKGNLCINKSTGVVVEDNTMIGGGYGASINSYDVVITGNEIYGQEGYTWSYGIGLGERWDVNDYVISDNYIHDVRWGVAVTGIGATPVMRENIQIVGNTFENNSGAALKVDRPASGSWEDNFVHADTPPVRIAVEIAEAGTFMVGESHVFDSDPEAVADSAALGELDVFATGNILANDESAEGLPLTLATVEGTEVRWGASIAGDYGTLIIGTNGTYVYLLDEAKLSGVIEPVKERFDYVVTDGDSEGASQLVIDIEPRPNILPETADDLITLNGLVGTGNVLANDTDQNGDALCIASVCGTEMTAGGRVIQGKYGTLTITEDGACSYVLDPVKLKGLTADTTDIFTYEAADGRGLAEGVIAVSIAAPKAFPAQKPVAVDDFVRVTPATGEGGRGNVLANDYDLNGTAVQLRTIGTAKVSNGEAHLAGRYGDLYFERDGDYRYVVDHDKVVGLSGLVKEAFSYKISDGALQDAGSLTVAIDLTGLVPVPETLGLA